MVEGLQGLVGALVSEGTLLSEGRLEPIVTRPLTGGGRVPPKSFPNPILSEVDLDTEVLARRSNDWSKQIGAASAVLISIRQNSRPSGLGLCNFGLEREFETRESWHALVEGV